MTHLLGVHELEACCRYFHVVTENANGLTNAAITMKILDDAYGAGAEKNWWGVWFVWPGRSI